MIELSSCCSCQVGCMLTNVIMGSVFNRTSPRITAACSPVVCDDVRNDRFSLLYKHLLDLPSLDEHHALARGIHRRFTHPQPSICNPRLEFPVLRWLFCALSLRFFTSRVAIAFSSFLLTVRYFEPSASRNAIMFFALSFAASFAAALSLMIFRSCLTSPLSLTLFFLMR